MIWLTVLTIILLNPLLPHETQASNHPVWLLERMPLNGRAGVKETVFDGRPSIIAAFATWCAPCTEEVPMLNKLHREHPDLRVIGISVDDGPPAKVRSWMRKYGVQYPVFLPNPDVLAGRSRIGDVSDLPLLTFFQSTGVHTRRLVGTVPTRLIARCLREIGVMLRDTP
jgi:thiol-disulfide isomerase/thioredoxin